MTTPTARRNEIAGLLHNDRKLADCAIEQMTDSEVKAFDRAYQQSGDAGLRVVAAVFARYFGELVGEPAAAAGGE